MAKTASPGKIYYDYTLAPRSKMRIEVEEVKQQAECVWELAVNQQLPHGDPLLDYVGHAYNIYMSDVFKKQFPEYDQFFWGERDFKEGDVKGKLSFRTFEEARSSTSSFKVNHLEISWNDYKLTLRQMTKGDLSCLIQVEIKQGIDTVKYNLP